MLVNKMDLVTEFLSCELLFLTIQPCMLVLQRGRIHRVSLWCGVFAEHVD